VKNFVILKPYLPKEVMATRDLVQDLCQDLKDLFDLKLRFHFDFRSFLSL